jgi:hypothetical protein
VIESRARGGFAGARRYSLSDEHPFVIIMARAARRITKG